jgi:hypothetical protein
MTKQTINVGTSPNDNRGDSLRASFQKINANFTELYTALGINADVNLNLGAFEFTGSIMTTTDSTAIVIDQATTVTSNLSVGGDILPQTANGGDLGSSTLPWRSLYVSNNTIYIGGVPLGIDANGNLTVNGSLITGGGGGSSLVNGAHTVSLASTGALTLSDTGVIQAQGKTIYALAVTDDGTTNTTINNYIRVSINWQANSSIWPTTGAFVIALAQGGTLTGPTNDNAIFTATITSVEYVSGNVFKIYTNRTGNMKRSGRYYIENVSGALDSVVQLQVRPDSLIAFPNGGGLRSESKTVTSSANGPITDLKVTNITVFPDGAGITVSNEPYGAPVGLNLSTSPSQTGIVNVLADSIYLQVTEQSTTTNYTNAIQITKDALTLGDVVGQNKWIFGSDGNLTFADAGGSFFGSGFLQSGTSGVNVGIKSWDGRQKVFVNETNVTIQAVSNSSQAYNWTFGTDGTTVFPSNTVKSATDAVLAITTGESVDATQTYDRYTDFSTNVIIYGTVLLGWYQRNSQQIEFALFGPSAFVTYVTGVSVGRTMTVVYETSSGQPNQFTGTITQAFTNQGQYDPAHPTWVRVSGRVDGTLPSNQTGIRSIGFPLTNTVPHTWQFGTDGVLTLPGGLPGTTGIITSGGIGSFGAGGSIGIGWSDSSSNPTQISAVTAYGNSGVVIQAGAVAGGPPVPDYAWTFGTDGSLTLPTNGTISYTPDDTDNWNEPAVNTIQAALDELAARVTALQNFEIDGGNAYTPALGELLIDGNGA